MKKIILWIIGIVIVVGIIAYFVTSNTSTNAPVATTTPVQNVTTIEPAKPVVPTVNSLTLAENVSGSSAVISNASLAQAGYIVIYKTDSAGKVSVIGHSVVLGPGEHTNISIPLDTPVKAKDVIVAVLHGDNGDGMFDIAAGDLPVVQNNAHVTAVDVIDVPQAATDASLVPSLEAYLKAQADAMMKATTTTKTTTTTITTTNNVLAVTVHGSNYKFSPSTIAAKLGQTVRVTFTNDGGLHDFVIDAFNAKTSQIQGGKSETIEFVADKKGSFEYYCSVGQHRAMGMKGTLTVN